jgi:MFS transporter, DHA2 family, multidrug resistance protein
MEDPTGHPRRWYILGVLLVSLLVVVLDNTILNVALKVISDPVHGLGATQSDLEWAINSYTLVFAALLFTWGVLGDRMGRRLVLLVGLGLFGAASVVSAYSQTPGQLIGARALMGIGGAAVIPATLSIISVVFPPAERGKAIGVWAGAVGLAIAIGPITGGLLLEHFWWGSVFLVNVPIVVLGGAAIALVVPESRDPHPGRLDPVGVGMSIVGLVALVYGIIEGGRRADWVAPGVLLPLLAGVAVLAAFVAYERRLSHPALDVRLFNDPRFSAAIAAIALVFFALMGVTFFVVFYLQSVRGFSPLRSGVLLLPLAAAQLLIAPRSAALVRRFGAKAVCTTGLLLVAGSFLGFLALDQTSPLWVLEVVFFGQGLGMGMVMPPATESILSTLPRQRSGVGSAMGNTARQVGGALGVAVLGSVLSASYRARMEPRLDFLPPAARHQAGESIAATVQVLGAPGLPEPGRQLTASVLADARLAFVHGMHITAAACTVVTLLGAVVVLIWLPGRTRASTPANTLQG